MNKPSTVCKAVGRPGRGKGYIRSSTSPASSSIFFVKKKEGIELLGSHVTLFWSSRYWSYSALFEWEVLGPTLAKDVRIYVSSGSVCAQCKAPRHLPRGKLHPLPVDRFPDRSSPIPVIHHDPGNCVSFLRIIYQS